jgi:hypothetical protein
MSDRTIYVLVVDNGDQCRDYEFLNKADAIATAKKHYQEGAFCVQVYHYTNNGANRTDDFCLERDVA